MAQETARDLLYKGTQMDWGAARIEVLLEALKLAEISGDSSVLVELLLGLKLFLSVLWSGNQNGCAVFMVR